MPLSKSQLAALVNLRHQLHRFPELSGQERNTARTVVSFLDPFNPDEILTNLGGHGVAAVFQGGREGPTVLVRCELDALRIHEISDAPHCSLVPGKSHSCGHDGHMAIVAGLGARLANQRPARGRVVLLYQPAEESGAGAHAVMHDPAFERIAPDFAFALHNLPGLRAGHAALKSGPLTCASRGLKVRFHGKTSHASAPEEGISPTHALSSFMRGAEALTSVPQNRSGLGPEHALVTVVHAVLGEPTFGVSPGAGQVWATLRTVADPRMDDLVAECETLARDLAESYGLGCDTSFDEVFLSSINEADATDRVARALDAEKVAIERIDEPKRFSEDFGRYGQRAKSCMFFLGAGEEHPKLHNPDYDFPDELIEPGSRIFHRIVRDLLG